MPRIVTRNQYALNNWLLESEHTAGLTVDLIDPDTRTPVPDDAQFVLHLASEPHSLAHAIIGLVDDAARTVVIFQYSDSQPGMDRASMTVRKRFPDGHIFYDVEAASAWLKKQVVPATV